ncbi:hypothetical protein Tco_0348524 [Tanacetum coccineum]
MDTLSEVSEYLNNLEAYLDDRDSLETRMDKIEKSEEELEMFEALEHNSVVMELGKHRVVDAELDMADSYNYIPDEMLGKLGFVRLDYGDYGRRMVNEVRVEIHGFIFLIDFVVLDYANEGESFVVFGRDVLVTTKCKVEFCLGEMRIDLTMLEEERDIDALLVSLVEDMDEVGRASSELVKMGKANQNKSLNVNKLTPPALLKIKEIQPISSYASPPVYHPLSPKQKEKILEALDRKYKELEEQKPIVEVLENYITYRKKLDEVMMGRARLENKGFGDEEKEKLIENGLPKKMCDSGNFVLPIRMNETTQMSALADTRASVSVLPYTLYKNIGLGYPRPYHSNLTMPDNIQAKDMGKLPLLLGRPFLRTCGAIIDMGRETMTIDDRIIRHTYFLKLRAKTYLENFEVDEDEVRRNEDGNPKYGPVAPSFIDIEDEMERCNSSIPIRDPKGMESIGRSKEMDYGMRNLRTPRLVDWEMFYLYGCDETLRNLMKTEYTHEDGDEFVDSGKELFQLKKMLCGEEHVLTLPEFAVLLGLYEQNELRDRVFAIHFNKLEINDKGFDHNLYWRKIREPTRTHKRTSLVKDPLMWVVHKLLVGAFVHRTWSRDRFQQSDLWLMSLLEGGHFVNVAWFIAEYLWYFVDEEVNKYSELIECETWNTKMFIKEFVIENMCLKQTVLLTKLIQVENEQRDEPSSLNSSWGNWTASLNEIERREVWRDLMLMRNNYVLEHSIPILHHLADLANYTYPTYEPPNVPPYPYLYVGYGGNSIVPSSGYEIRGSSRGVQDDDEMND